jgi:hypothetical protein
MIGKLLPTGRSLLCSLEIGLESKYSHFYAQPDLSEM